MHDVLMRCMNEDLLPRWYEHIDLEDHDLEELRKLGHPYAVRFGVDSFMHPDSEVHKQDGSLYEGTSVQTKGNAVILVNTSPHYIFLRYGTSTMRMRDPGGAALGEALKPIKARFATEVRGAIVQYFTS